MKKYHCPSQELEQVVPGMGREDVADAVQAGFDGRNGRFFLFLRDILQRREKRERAKYVASGSERARGREREHADSPFFESQLEVTHTAGPCLVGGASRSRSQTLRNAWAGAGAVVVWRSWEKRRPREKVPIQKSSHVVCSTRRGPSR